MAQEEHLQQALRLTITDLSDKLVDESTTKNLLALQLTDCKALNQSLTEEVTSLQARVNELETLLDEKMQPAHKGV